MTDSVHRKLLENDGKTFTARELREIFCLSPATAITDTYIRQFLIWQQPSQKVGRRVDRFKVDIPPALVETWLKDMICEDCGSRR